MMYCWVSKPYLFLHSSDDAHLGYFDLLLVDICAQVWVEALFLLLLGVDLGVLFLGHMEILFHFLRKLSPFL